MNRSLSSSLSSLECSACEMGHRRTAGMVINPTNNSIQVVPLPHEEAVPLADVFESLETELLGGINKAHITVTLLRPEDSRHLECRLQYTHPVNGAQEAKTLQRVSPGTWRVTLYESTENRSPSRRAAS